MIGYPTNRLLMVVDDPERARVAAVEVVGAGIRDEDIMVLVGEGGVDDLMGLGETHIPLAWLFDIIAPTWQRELPHAATYEAALRDGRAVVAVRPRGRAQMLEARDVVLRSGGHLATWCGRFRTQELARWRGPEPPEVPRRLRR